MPADLLGYCRRILIDPESNLGKILSIADTMLNGSTISESKMFFVSDSFGRHKKILLCNKNELVPGQSEDMTRGGSGISYRINDCSINFHPCF